MTNRGRVRVDNIYLKATSKRGEAFLGCGTNQLEFLTAWADLQSGLSGKRGVSNFITCTIGKGSYLKEGEFDSSKKTFVNGSTELSRVQINPELTVGGVIVDTSNSLISIYPRGKTAGIIDWREGKLVFDNVAGSLGNANLPSPYGKSLVYNSRVEQLKISVAGNNDLKALSGVSDTYGIYSVWKVSLEGATTNYADNKLTYRGDNGIDAEYDKLSIANVTLDIKGESPISCPNDKLTITKSKIVAEDTRNSGDAEAIVADECELDDCDVVGGYYYSGEDDGFVVNSFVDNKGKPMSDIEIRPISLRSHFYILGRQVNDVNAEDFAAKGWVEGKMELSSSHKLTLKDVYINAYEVNPDAAGIEILYAEGSENELRFDGDCGIIIGNKPALNIESGNVTITSTKGTWVELVSVNDVGCNIASYKSLTLKASVIFIGGMTGGLKGTSTSILNLQRGEDSNYIFAGGDIIYEINIDKLLYPSFYMPSRANVSSSTTYPAFTVGKLVNEDGLGFDFTNLEIAELESAYWDDDKKMPIQNGGAIADFVELIPVNKFYGIKVGGVKVNDVNCDGIAGKAFCNPGSYQATYDDETKTLKLNNAYIDTAGLDDYGIDMGDFTQGTDNESGSGTIEINGENVVLTKSGVTALFTIGNLTITSATKDFKSTLELNSRKGVCIDLHFSSGIMDRWLVIKDKAYVRLTGHAAEKGLACASYDAPHGNVTVNDATLDVVYGGIGKLKSLKLVDCIFTLPEAARFDLDRHVVVDPNGVVAKQVQIRSLNDNVTPKLGHIAINEENFPCENFRTLMVSDCLDLDKDGFLSPSEVDEAVEIICNFKATIPNGMKGIERFPNLKKLTCSEGLGTIDLSRNKELEQLTILKCKLTEGLDVSNNEKLKELCCIYDDLTKLDLSKNTELKSLYCNNNQLTELDLSKNVKLTMLSIYQNQIKGAKMDALISSLPTVTSGGFDVIDNSSSDDHNVCTTLQVAAAKAKGWKVFCYDKYFDDWVVYNGSAAEQDIAVGSALVAGFSSSNTLDFTGSDVSAWIATGFRGGNVMLSRVNKVPGGTGLYLKAPKAGTYTVPVTSDKAYYANFFVGTPDGLTVEPTENVGGETYQTLSFAMSKTTGKPAFFPNTADKTYGEGKMYLHLPAWALGGAARLNDKVEMINDNRGGVTDTAGETVTVTVSEVGAAGFSSDKNVDFTGITGISAWIATGFVDGNVLLSRVYAVPAGTGVYLKADNPGTAVTRNIPVTMEKPCYANLFVGTGGTAVTVQPTEEVDGEVFRTLSFAKSKTTGKPAFFPNTEEKEYAAGKMYLRLPNELVNLGSDARQMASEDAGDEARAFGLVFCESEYLDGNGDMANGTTAIRGRMADGVTDNRGVYDLQGRKVRRVRPAGPQGSQPQAV